MKKAIIVGCEGQDGQLLRDALLEREYSIVGVGRKSILSTQYDTGANQINQWRRRLLEELPDIFSKKRKRKQEDAEELRDFLK